MDDKEGSTFPLTPHNPDCLKALGSTSTQYAYDEPTADLLEKFDSPFVSRQLNPNHVLGEVKIECPEFTCVCPKTGQPDYATIVINYLPRLHCLESKSLKLYLNSFRNHGEFHESCVNRITNDLINLLDPWKITVIGQFAPRGGIPFWPNTQYVRSSATEQD